eukprot:9283422-Pyramimonas_sp.AAC.1
MTRLPSISESIEEPGESSGTGTPPGEGDLQAVPGPDERISGEAVDPPSSEPPLPVSSPPPFPSPVVPVRPARAKLEQPSDVPHCFRRPLGDEVPGDRSASCPPEVSEAKRPR